MTSGAIYPIVNATLIICAVIRDDTYNKVGTGSDADNRRDNSCAIQLSVGGGIIVGTGSCHIVIGGMAQNSWHAGMIISNVDNL